jgi:hypothetical protein
MWASIETPESADLERLLTERESGQSRLTPRRAHWPLTLPMRFFCISVLVGHKVTPAEAAKKTANRAIKKDGRKKSRKQDVQKLTNVHMMALVSVEIAAS